MTTPTIEHARKVAAALDNSDPVCAFCLATGESTSVLTQRLPGNVIFTVYGDATPEPSTTLCQYCLHAMSLREVQA